MLRKTSYFLGVVFSVLFMALAALVSMNYKSSPIPLLDTELQNFAHSLSHNQILAIAAGINAKLLDNQGGLILFVLILFILWFIFKQKIGATWLALITIGTVATNVLLKHLIQRVRPDSFRISGFENELGFSFPSGHSSFSTILFFGLLLIILQKVTKPSSKTFLVLLAVFLVLFTMFARIFLGVHYPSDTIGGLLVGMAFIAFTYPTYLNKNNPHHY